MYYLFSVITLIISIITFLLGLFLGNQREKRRIKEQEETIRRLEEINIKLTMLLKWHDGSTQMSDDIQSEEKKKFTKKVYPEAKEGKREEYAKRSYSESKEEKKRRKVFLNALVEKRIKRESKDIQRAVGYALRRLAEGLFSHSIKKLSEGKFYVYRVGRYRLIFEEKEDKILVVDFVKRASLPKALKEINIENA
jgi:mRNA-degrading endonuclease RelE of RelBE toxin-antitoxin system